VDWLQIILLSLLQGLTEFLPISSSAHLLLPALLTDWPDQGLAFDVGVHFGTLIAVITYFRVELGHMAGSLINYPRQRVYTSDLDLILKLGVATLPVAIVGFVGKDFVEASLRSVPVIAASTMIFAVALWLADRNPQGGDTPTWKHAAIIGAAQVLALVPGTSRSGITITAALMVGLSRSSAARFSFLLAIPTIAGAQLLLTADLLEVNADRVWANLISGALVSGLAAYVCIHFFIALVERTGMLPYVIYRLILGAALFGVYLYW